MFTKLRNTLLKIKWYIYGDSLAAAGCQRLALNLRPAMVTVKMTVNGSIILTVH